MRGRAAQEGSGLHQFTATESHRHHRGGFGIRALVRLRIISVPCGGLSWRRDRLPEDDDALSAKSAGIESRADSGRRGCTASSQLGASSPETAAGLNHGHQSARVVLVAETGIQLKKQWLCVRDQWTRESHLEADRQEVQAGDDFTVGGERCSYPGDRRLSAEERIHCRCTSITVGILEALGITVN